MKTKSGLTYLLVTVLLLLVIGCSNESPETKYKTLLSKAADFKKENKLEEARITLMSAIDTQPKAPEAYFELAETVIQQKKFGAALENYQTTLNLDPSFWKARLKIAALLLASKKVDVAETHVTELLKTHSAEIEVQLLNASLANTRGDMATARKILKPLQDSHPENAAVLASLANIEISEGNIETAAKLYERVAELEPGNDGVKLALADIYIRQGDQEKGQQLIENLIETNPENTALRFRFGEFLLKEGQAEGALEQYKAILEIDPTRHYARDRLYDMYLIRKVVDQAKELTPSLKAAAKEDPAVFYFEGRDKELEGAREEALALYLKAMPGLNNFAPVFRRAGLIEIESNKQRQGVEHLQQAIAIDPGDVGARLGLARDLFSKKEFTQAKEHIAVVLRRYPKQIGANVLAADIALIEGNLDGARQIYQVMIDSFPNAPVNYMKLGLVEERDGKIEKAEELYRKALSFDANVAVPARRLAGIIAKKNSFEKAIQEIASLAENSKNGKVDYLMLLGSMYASAEGKQQYEKARGYFQQVVEMSPNNFPAYYALARLDTQAGKISAAITQYEKALAANPDHLPSSMLLGIAYEHTKQVDKAKKIYGEILKNNPRFGPAANNLAWIYVDSGGDLDQALALAKVAKEELPETSAVADTLGWIYFKRGSAQLALPYLKEAVQLEQSQGDGGVANPEILYHYAAALHASEQTTEAKQIIASALKLVTAEHPRHAEMKKFADSLQ